MVNTIALLGALDTKGTEYAFVKRCIEARGLRTLVIDVGILGPPALEADVAREEVAGAAGESVERLAEAGDRGHAVEAMARGAGLLVEKLYQEGRFDGIMALGGTGGTSLACSVMRRLPFGVPKLMVSTVAGGDVSAYVGGKDIAMVPSVVDVSGLNRISRPVLTRAAGAICGMVTADVPEGDDKPIVAASMFGNTTAAVEQAKAALESEGYEVLVFHCTGLGGRTMEGLIAAGLVRGVLDITTTEWADECAGGVFSAGPDRLCAAADNGIPAVIVPGCLDMVNFGAPETVPGKYAGRLFYRHNADVTLMRTTPEENVRIGEEMAERINRSKGPVSVLLPLRGLSVIGAEGGPFHDSAADKALFDTLKNRLRPDIPVVELDCAINDPVFAELCAKKLLDLMAAHPREEL